MAGAFDLESVLRRDRLVVVIALVAVIVLSWAYVLAGAGMGMSAFKMTRMTGGGVAMDGMMVSGSWTAGYAVVIFLMWWVMMLGMMLASTTLNPSRPKTLPSWSTTAMGSSLLPILQVQLGW